VPRVRNNRMASFARSREPTCFYHSSPYNDMLVKQEQLERGSARNWLQVVGRLDEEQPGSAGGSLTSKPTWSSAFGRSATSAFFVV